MFTDKIICHDTDAFAQRFASATYKIREADGAYGINKRHCSYCGSLHPEDLLNVLEAGARLELADMKYGWPHKFYVSGIVNPKGGEIVQMGSNSGPVKDKDGNFVRNEDGSIQRYNEPIMSSAPRTLSVKFYNIHLLDLKEHLEAFQKVTDAIAKHSNIRFFLKDDQLFCKKEA